DPGLLGQAHRLRGLSERGSGSGLDLAEHDRPPEAENKIQLAVPTAPVAVEHLVAVSEVPVRGAVLPRDAEGAPALRPHRPGNGYSSFSGSSSTLTSLKVTTRTDDTKRAGRYMSHTQASLRAISK